MTLQSRQGRYGNSRPLCWAGDTDNLPYLWSRGKALAARTFNSKAFLRCIKYDTLGRECTVLCIMLWIVIVMYPPLFQLFLVINAMYLLLF
ncbi:Serine/threonine-protein phosphatase BSL1 [Trichinella pseudospiralis]